MAAHLAWASVLRPLETEHELSRMRFQVDRFVAATAVRWADRGVPAILDQLRRVADQQAIPMGMSPTKALPDAVVQALGIRVRLVAEDQEWATGSGAEVVASDECVLLVLTGRPVRPGELSGSGAETLAARL